MVSLVSFEVVNLYLKFKIEFEFASFVESWNYILSIGIDLKTGEEVAIKFATENRHYSLENEYVNYLYLGADGKLNCRI